VNAGILEKPKTVRPAGRQSPGAAAPLGRHPAPGRAAKGEPATARTWRRGIKDEELVALCRHLGALAGSGISLVEALRTFADETRPGVFREVLEGTIHDLEAGRKLSEAFDRHPDHFSPYFRASVWAGEATGSMAETFDRLSVYLDNRRETRQRVRNAFAYPVMLTVVAVAVVSFLMAYVVPVFAGVYGRMGVPLPGVTQALVSVSNLVVSRPWVPGIAAGMVAACVLWGTRTEAGRLWTDQWKVRAPIVGPLFKQMVLYRFMRSFGEIMGAGLPVLDALDLAGKVAGNIAFQLALEPVRADVQRGMGLTEPLRRTGWFSPSLLQVIASGEKSGRVPVLLARAADILQKDVDLSLKRAVSRIEPLVTVGMAAMVGFILLAVYLPMFDVMQHVGK